MRYRSSHWLLILVLAGLLAAPAFASSIPVGYAVVDIFSGAPTSAFEFDIWDLSGPNNSLPPDFPVTNQINLNLWSLVVTFNDLTTQSFGPSYFTLQPDGLDWTGTVESFPNSNPPVSATITGAFATTSFDVYGSGTVTVLPDFTVSIMDSPLQDQDNGVIYATTETIPEPLTWWLAASGAGLLLLFRHRRAQHVRAILNMLAVLSIAIVAASYPARAAVALTTWANANSGTAGGTVVYLTGSGFPAAPFDLGQITVTLSASCGGPVAAATPASTFTHILGSTYRVGFLIPAALTVSGLYYVQVSGQNTAQTPFASGNCSELNVTVPTLINTYSNSSTRTAATYYGTVTGGGIYRIIIPDPALSGNCLVAAGSYDNTYNPTITITDDKSNTWVVDKQQIDTTNNQGVYIAHALNVVAGTRYVYVSPSADSTNFSGAALQFNNCTALDAVSAGSSGSGTTVTAGNISPSVSGDIVVQFSANSYDRNNFPVSTSFTPGSQSNITWALAAADVLDGLAVQWGVYSSTSTFNPSMTEAPGGFNSVAIALKTGAAGTAPSAGIRVVGIQHNDVWEGGPTTMPLQWPTRGNLLVALVTTGKTTYYLNSITGSNGNTWQPAMSTVTCNVVDSYYGDIGQVYYVPNATPSNSATLTLNWNATGDNGGHGIVVLYDIAGAAAAPLDQAASLCGNQGTAGNMATITITPTAPNELVIGDTGVAYNTMTGALNGVLADMSYYSGETLSGPSPVDENDATGAHYYSPNTNPVTFTWTELDGSTPAEGWAAQALSFLPLVLDPTAEISSPSRARRREGSSN